jgi:uncharacterized protein YkwD
VIGAGIPPVMPRTRIIVALAAALALLAAAAPASATTLRQNERTILAELNKARTARGLVPLKVDPRLQTAARAHSVDMLRRDYFSHAGFGARMSRSGAAGPAFAENLYWGTGPHAYARRVVAGWLASPGHRANLLRPGFRRIGIARAVGEFSGYSGASVITANFAGR